jgi:hypothetical protein
MKSDYNYSGIIRRDFRQSHDEPEVPRWRKKAKRHVDKSRCKHEYSDWAPRNWKYPQPPILRTKSRSDGYKTESRTYFDYEYRACRLCGKHQSRHRQVTKFKHFHWDKMFFENEYTTEWKTRW